MNHKINSAPKIKVSDKKITVSSDKIHDFLKENEDNIVSTDISYRNWDSIVKRTWVRLVALNWETFQKVKGRSNWVSRVPLEKLMDFSADITLKHPLKFSKIERDQIENYKKIEKYRKLEFHPSLKSNEFAVSCSKLPKTFDEYIEDSKGHELFWKKDAKSLFDYWVTSWCAKDWKVITWKRINKIFWEGTTEALQKALDNKVSFERFENLAYDYSLWLHIWSDWKNRLYLNEEYKWCGNGHYYAWVNANTFIYIEKD